MRKREHYATKYKKRIKFLTQMIQVYYRANYGAKQAIGENPGIYAISDGLFDNEERLCVLDEKGMREIIKHLPLFDCGC